MNAISVLNNNGANSAGFWAGITPPQYSPGPWDYLLKDIPPDKFYQEINYLYRAIGVMLEVHQDVASIYAETVVGEAEWGRSALIIPWGDCSAAYIASRGDRYRQQSTTTTYPNASVPVYHAAICGADPISLNYVSYSRIPGEYYGSYSSMEPFAAFGSEYTTSGVNDVMEIGLSAMFVGYGATLNVSGSPEYFPYSMFVGTEQYRISIDTAGHHTVSSAVHGATIGRKFTTGYGTPQGSHVGFAFAGFA
jgi:hypothetical protein